MTSKHQLINQSSGIVEYYSPSPLVEAARMTMGGIDLDGASSARANDHIVKAANFFAKPDMIFAGTIKGLPAYRMSDRGGLDYPWYGRVWLNHPFGIPMRACTEKCNKKTCTDRGYHIITDTPGNDDWISHVVTNYLEGRVSQACILTFASTSEAWYKPLKAYPQCFIDGRTSFIDPGTLKELPGSTKGCTVTYLGPFVMAFAANFSQFGEVKGVISTSLRKMRDAFCQEFGEPGEIYEHRQHEELFKIFSKGWTAAYGDLSTVESAII